MITRYGYDVYFTVLGICIAIILLALLFVEQNIARYVCIAVALAVLVFVTNFFRDPERSVPTTEKGIISPADGKVIAVKEIDRTEYLEGRSIMISIFMSPLNVHVNRNPVSGTVEHLRYVKGEYFAAYEDKASEKNEQSVIGITNQFGKVLMKQIAGFVARRIVTDLSVGDRVTAGERFGMIKFGSRVDLFVPLRSRILARIGDVAVAGETVLAEFP